MTLLKRKPELSSSIAKNLASYKIQITNGIEAEKERKERARRAEEERKEQARLAAIEQKRQEEAERREQERILAEKVKIHLTAPVPDQPNLWFAKQNEKWGVVKGTATTKQENFEVVIPFENDVIAYFELWKRFFVGKIYDNEEYYRLYDNKGEALSSFVHVYEVDLPSFMCQLSQNKSSWGYIGNPSILNAIACYGPKDADYYYNQFSNSKLTNEKVLIKMGSRVINMNGEVVLFLETSKGGNIQPFSLYNGLYCLGLSGGDILFDYKGNRLLNVDYDIEGYNSNYKDAYNLELALEKYGVFVVGNTYYKFRWEYCFRIQIQT